VRCSRLQVRLLALLFVRILFLRQDSWFFAEFRGEPMEAVRGMGKAVVGSRQRLECAGLSRRCGFRAPAATARGLVYRGEGKAVLQARALQTLARVPTGGPESTVFVLPGFREEPDFWLRLCRAAFSVLFAVVQLWFSGRKPRIQQAGITVTVVRISFEYVSNTRRKWPRSAGRQGAGAISDFRFLSGEWISRSGGRSLRSSPGRLPDSRLGGAKL